MKGKTFVRVALVGVGLAGATATPAVAAPIAGTSRVTTPEGTALSGGGSATGFTLALPAGAACSGDSAHDNFRVQSYMVPESVDPGTLQFGSVGPQPTSSGAAFRQALFTSTTAAYANAQTANADHRGDTGTIINVPAFNLAVFARGDIPPGAYNLGLACTKGPASAAQVERYWNARMSVEESATDVPAGVTWTVPGQSTAASHATSASASSASVAPTSAATGAASTSAADSALATSDVEGPAPTGGLPSMNVPAFSLRPGGLGRAIPWLVGAAIFVLLAAAAARSSTRKTIFQPGERRLT